MAVRAMTAGTSVLLEPARACRDPEVAVEAVPEIWGPRRKAAESELAETSWHEVGRSVVWWAAWACVAWASFRAARILASRWPS